jgi:dCMP deaminase
MSSSRGIEWWDRYFLGLAEYASRPSKDPSTKCGAVIVRPDKTVVSTGYNGFPMGCFDRPTMYEDRELKYSRVVHAEMNALLHSFEPLEGYTMYTFPKGYGPSCDRCSAHIIQSGISRVVHYGVESDDFASRWKEACECGLDMYVEAGVTVTKYETSTSIAIDSFDE